MWCAASARCARNGHIFSIGRLLRPAMTVIPSFDFAHTLGRVARAATAVAPLFAAPTLVVAQEYCVACNGPDATYRCVIVDPRPGAATTLQAACLGVMAKAGGHAQCSVKSGVTVFECDAPVKRISLADAEPVLLAPPAPPLADPNAPPKTLLEAAGCAKAAADRQAEKNAADASAALKATGNFFQKSLACLTSLFTKCQ
jgi:hypothetical protein